MMNKPVLIVSSGGGHLVEIATVVDSNYFTNITYVLNTKNNFKGIDCLFVKHSERDLVFFVNLIEAFKIIRSIKPSIIFSSGAGVVVPFAVVARLFFPSIKIFYFESISKYTSLTLTGRFMYFLSHKFVVYSPMLKAMYPKSILLKLDLTS